MSKGFSTPAVLGAFAFLLFFECIVLVDLTLEFLCFTELPPTPEIAEFQGAYLLFGPVLSCQW